jgi:hypothetical protein
MSMSTPLSELRKKQQAHSEIIEDEQRQPSSDDLSIKQLKLKKLYLKEEIERLAAGACPRRPSRDPAGPVAGLLVSRPRHDESDGTLSCFALLVGQRKLTVSKPHWTCVANVWRLSASPRGPTR